MSWWGKLIGGAFGYMAGGPIGLVIGAAIGHNFDRGLVDVLHRQNYGENANSQSFEKEKTQTAFFAATFAVMGHIAKSDGRVSEIEIRMADNVMSQMNLSEQQKQYARSLFNEGKKENFDLIGVLAQLKNECRFKAHLIQVFIEIQIALLLADGVVHSKERKLIHDIGEQLGFNPGLIDQLIKMHQAYQRFTERGSDYRKTETSPDGPLEDAYAVLGVKATDSDEKIKKAYRRLMNQHHPDKLVAKGLPEEMLKIATEKTQEIKLAYEKIKKTRKTS